MKLNRGGGQLGKRTKGRKGKKEKLTQRFGECGEVGVGEGEGGNLSHSHEPPGNRRGKDIARDFQGNGKRGFWETRRKKKNSKNRKKKG